MAHGSLMDHGHTGADDRSELLGSLGRDPGQNHHELVSAEAIGPRLDRVEVDHAAVQDSADAAQELAAGAMSQAIVHRLQAIDVQEDDAEILVERARLTCESSAQKALQPVLYSPVRSSLSAS